MACLDYNRSWFKRTRVPPDRIVALVTEMVQGVGGSVVPPTDYVEEIKIFLDGHGILSIDDEVQTGWGRTGRMWATDHFDVHPDILITAKAIANGLPLSAIIGRRWLWRKRIQESIPTSLKNFRYG